MKIKKALGANVAIAVNVYNHECVVMGKGVGYGKKPGDIIDHDTIERIFSPKEKGLAEKISLMIEHIPLEHIRLCDEIINFAKKELENQLSDRIYLTLIDHISFAIKRNEEGMDLTCSLKWEMRHFYPREYRVGLEALHIIKNRLDVVLPEDEAAFIAFHLVNAGVHKEDDAQKLLLLVRDISEIVKRRYQERLGISSIHYDRFLAHLQYFARRMLNDRQEQIDQSGDIILQNILVGLEDEHECVEEIAQYLRETYQYTLENEEKVYFVIHLHNLLTH